MELGGYVSKWGRGSSVLWCGVLFAVGKRFSSGCVMIMNFNLHIFDDVHYFGV